MQSVSSLRSIVEIYAYTPFLGAVGHDVGCIYNTADEGMARQSSLLGRKEQMASEGTARRGVVKWKMVRVK